MVLQAVESGENLILVCIIDSFPSCLEAEVEVNSLSTLNFSASAAATPRPPSSRRPPKYPPRLNRPCPLVDNPEQTYMLAISKEFEQHMRSSPYYIKSDATENNAKKSVERYSDRYEDAAETTLELDWARFPQELRPDFRKRMARKRRASGAKPKLVSRKKDVSKTLEELEKKEGDEKSEDDEEGKEKNDDDSDDEKKENATVEESDKEEIDEEMDDGTDYANNYFDNGEGYLDDEDDNLDEGGTY